MNLTLSQAPRKREWKCQRRVQPIEDDFRMALDVIDDLLGHSLQRLNDFLGRTLNKDETAEANEILYWIFYDDQRAALPFSYCCTVHGYDEDNFRDQLRRVTGMEKLIANFEERMRWMGQRSIG